jgi:hypothetical protein
VASRAVLSSIKLVSCQSYVELIKDLHLILPSLHFKFLMPTCCKLYLLTCLASDTLKIRTATEPQHKLRCLTGNLYLAWGSMVCLSDLGREQAMLTKVRMSPFLTSIKKRSYASVIQAYLSFAIIFLHFFQLRTSSAAGTMLYYNQMNKKLPFTSPYRPDRLWGPPSLLYNGYRELFPRG